MFTYYTFFWYVIQLGGGVRNRVFVPNPVDKMKTRVGEKLYRLGIVKIPCNNQGYFNNNDYIIVQLSILILTMIQTISTYSASIFFFLHLLLRTYFLRLCKFHHSFFFVVSDLMYSHIFRLLN